MNCGSGKAAPVDMILNSIVYKRLILRDYPDLAADLKRKFKL